MTVDHGEPRFAVGVDGLLGAFNDVGVLDAADVRVAERIGVLGGEAEPDVLLAVALAVRALRQGSVCVDLGAVDRTVLGEGDVLVDTSALPWPEPDAWRAACRASPLVADGPDAPAGRPVRLVDGQLYLERYWSEEELVRHALVARAGDPPVVDIADVAGGLGSADDPRTLRQRQAAAVAALRRVTVLAGGPGTGKTTTVARMLTLLLDLPAERPLRVALAAPTGKAAARLQEAVADALPERLRGRVDPATTLHRLLGWRPGTRAFRHDRHRRLPVDVVVVDETSMVSLTLMARLLDALRPQARLVLVGDPDQLASVEAGAVLGDLAGARGRPEPALDAALAELGLPGGVVHGVVTLEHVWRFGGAIAELARAVQRGDPDAALDVLHRGDPAVRFVDAPDDGLWTDVLDAGRTLVRAARAGDTGAALDALDAHRLLCAHRRGPFGVARWAGEVERRLAAVGAGADPTRPWYPGRAVLVTANDHDAGLYNGDTGVTVGTPDGVRVAFVRGGPPQLYAAARLPEVTGVHAMTVHRAQGSQFARATVLLPPPESPLLTRELLYTAVTRAREGVRVVGTDAAVRAAVLRPVGRASGLRHRLDPAR